MLIFIDIYYLHVNGPRFVLNMVYGVSNEIITQKILDHKSCKFIISCSQSVMELRILFAKNGYTSIMIIYLDQVK
jgi:hypothetical protein